MTMKWLNEMVCEELEGAETYVKKAIHFKDLKDSRKMALFHEMAMDELKHANNFMELAKECYEKGESEMSKDLWEYLRDKAMEEQDEIKYYMAVLKM